MLAIITKITKIIGGCFFPLFGENGRKSETWFLKFSSVATLMMKIKQAVIMRKNTINIVYLLVILSKEPLPIHQTVRDGHSLPLQGAL